MLLRLLGVASVVWPAFFAGPYAFRRRKAHSWVDSLDRTESYCCGWGIALLSVIAWVLAVQAGLWLVFG